MNRFFKFSKVAAFFLLASLVSWGLGLAWFSTLTSKPAGTASGQLDGIVTLTGGPERIAAGLALLDSGHGARLLVSGVNPDVSVNDVTHTLGIDIEKLACCVDLGRSATDTITNAEEAAVWVREKQMKSIWLVTADYHMPRALALFKSALPETEIQPWPVEAPVSLRYFIIEYHKFLVTLVRSGAPDMPDQTGDQS